MPKGAYGFRFYDQEEEDRNGEMLKGVQKNYSGWYFIGRKMTLEDVKKEMPDSKILISNMECNRYKAVVHTKRGQCFSLGDNDIVMAE